MARVNWKNAYKHDMTGLFAPDVESWDPKWKKLGGYPDVLFVSPMCAVHNHNTQVIEVWDVRSLRLFGKFDYSSHMKSNDELVLWTVHPHKHHQLALVMDRGTLLVVDIWTDKVSNLPNVHFTDNFLLLINDRGVHVWMNSNDTWIHKNVAKLLPKSVNYSCWKKAVISKRINKSTILLLINVDDPNKVSGTYTYLSAFHLSTLDGTIFTREVYRIINDDYDDIVLSDSCDEIYAWKRDFSTKYFVFNSQTGALKCSVEINNILAIESRGMARFAMVLQMDPGFFRILQIILNQKGRFVDTRMARIKVDLEEWLYPTSWGPYSKPATLFFAINTPGTLLIAVEVTSNYVSTDFCVLLGQLKY
jgi:hypothetical protein